MRCFFLVLLVLLSVTALFAQTCDTDQNTLIIKISTDRFGRETSWVLGNPDSIYGGVDKNVYDGVLVDVDTFCITAQTCLTFTIFDGFGDGIQEGGYEIFLNGERIAANQEFGLSETVEINCAKGTVCAQAIAIQEGSYTAPMANAWYQFMPDSVGTYEISTCENNTCDTRIWVYDRCESVRLGDNEGFIFFNEDACGMQASVRALLDVGQTYLIRISDNNRACGASPINWSIEYNGPVVGCMDSTACNYNPLATVASGDCIPQGAPNCPSGPDLMIREDVLISSLQVDTLFNEDPCLINEGCLSGFGKREIIRFTTRFENIGTQDYYIGVPTTESTQFTFDNCHNHFHYDNYAEYLLYDASGNRLPAGFKSGFCVVDLSCTTGNNKYGCNNMGLSVGCYDEYNSNLDCQWIDVTDYPDGNYTFVARVNWSNQPDLVGRVESELSNNWSQACLTLNRSSGQLVATVLADCPAFIDCEGTLYGTTEKDCSGVCGGTTLTGDVDGNGLQDRQDIQEYLSMIRNAEEGVTPCNDLNGDDQLTVYDAALLADCLNFGKTHAHPEQGIHDHCDFPTGIYNSLDTVRLKITEFDPINQTIDVAIQNTSSSVVGYQFQLAGIEIQSVESLIEPTIFPVQLQASISPAAILGLSIEQGGIEQSRTYQPFLRIHYLSITEPTICINKIDDIVNGAFQQVVTKVEGDCLNAMTTSEQSLVIEPLVRVTPNPFNRTAMIQFPNPNQATFSLQLINVMGRQQFFAKGIQGNSYEINRADLPHGIYLFYLASEQQMLTGKIIIKGD